MGGGTSERGRDGVVVVVDVEVEVVARRVRRRRRGRRAHRLEHVRTSVLILQWSAGRLLHEAVLEIIT